MPSVPMACAQSFALFIPTAHFAMKTRRNFIDYIIGLTFCTFTAAGVVTVIRWMDYCDAYGFAIVATIVVYSNVYMALV
ncbi:Hypp141 [Branchiostoma lanceolatum]|uniref:Hypp141 protein n=1 Tax=Branchiostoma lanceolatum TaxID=7740 RepID=A0A8J9VXP9_BRALA|nr:Hypp141 [Branchiostoma lanceolatum]